MNKIGSFKISGSFKVTGRGRIVTGQILDGKVQIDSFTYLKIDDKLALCRITGVDLGKPILVEDSIIGLSLTSKEVDLEIYSIEEQVVEILDD